MTIGILPNVNFTEQKRDVQLEIHVCSRIIRLKNNRTKSRKELPFPQRRRKRRQKCCGYCENSQVDSQENPMQKVLEPIQRVRFTQSTLRQASIREKKGPSLAKIQVNVPHQRSPNAMKFEDRSQEETQRQQRCA